MIRYKTEILTSVLGRDKLRHNDLNKCLDDNAKAGWELVTLALNADIKGEHDGHLLVFKRES